MIEAEVPTVHVVSRNLLLSCDLIGDDDSDVGLV
jgi:hypothetical protein